MFRPFRLPLGPLPGTFCARPLGSPPDPGNRSFCLVRCCGALSLVFVAVVLAVRTAAAADTINVKLNAPLPSGSGISAFAVTPDGTRVLFRTKSVQGRPADLFSVPIDGGQVHNLTDIAELTGDVLSFQISAESRRAVFTANTGSITAPHYELFSVPVGVGKPVKLNDSIAGLGISVFAISPDGSRVVYVADRNTRDMPELYSVPIDGSAAPSQLNGDLVSGGAVTEFRISPDSTRVIYRADQNLDEVFELFSVPIDGSSAAFRISGPMVAGGDVTTFAISPDGARVVYIADQDVGNRFELYSVPSNGGIVTKLNQPLPTFASGVRDFTISPDSHSVLYRADQNTAFLLDLFQAPITGGPVRQINLRVFTSTKDVSQFFFSPDGRYIIYTGYVSDNRPLELNSVSLADGSPRIYSDPFSAAPRDVLTAAASSDSIWLVYTFAQNPGYPFELYSVTMNGSSGITPLNGPLFSGGHVRDFRITPDGARVIYLADQDTAGIFELYSVPIAGGTVTKLNQPVSHSLASSFGISPDGKHVVYTADQDTAGLSELYTTFDAPAVAFTQESYVVTEDGSIAAPLAVERHGIVDAPGSVRVALTSGTATGGAILGPGVDFVDNAVTANFAAGAVTATVGVDINNDGVAEAPENFSMQLFDAQNLTITAPVSVEVVIKDSSQAPLLEDTRRTLAENSPNGTKLLPSLSPAALQARPAGSQQLTFTILSGNVLNAFRFEGDTLVVNNSAALDFETRPVFALTVQAEDSRGSFDVATVEVDLTNQNDPPSITGGSFAVAEYSRAGTLVGTLAAHDEDAAGSLWARLVYSLDSSVFAIDNFGRITVNDPKALDFETTNFYALTAKVTDGGGLSAFATAKIKVINVVEPDPNAITLSSFIPSAAIAGGGNPLGAFWLRVSGVNFPTNAVVQWNGNARRTVFINSTVVYGLISSTDIAKAGKAAVTVTDLFHKRTSNKVYFPILLGKVGISALAVATPAGGQRSLVGETTVFTLTWTHTDNAPWRSMGVMDLRLRDEQKTALWIRYTEAFSVTTGDLSTLTLLNADGTPAGSGRFGSQMVLEDETVKVDLSQARFIGSGDKGSTVSVVIPVVFKAAAVHERPYNVELFATDDSGGEQGPDLAGSWEVLSALDLYLPAVRN